MGRGSLRGLRFESFLEIPDFDGKLTEFLNSLDDELNTWRDYVEKNGKRSIPHIIAGYACLDGEKIIGISYFFVPKKLRIQYFINSLLARAPQKAAEAGFVVKKEYQRRGIAVHLLDLKNDIARKMGYKHIIYSSDSNNIAVLKLAEKRGDSIVKTTDKKIYFAYNPGKGNCKIPSEQ